MDLVQAVYRRRSIRTFQPGGLDPLLLQKIGRWIGEGVDTPFRTPIEFMLIEADKTPNGQKLGTYGTIKGADVYLAGGVRASAPMALEDFAYGFETMLLKMTTLGLGSCWLGAAFKRDQFAELMGLAEDRIIPAVSPLGFAAQKARLRESITLKIMNARQRKPAIDLFFAERFQKPLSLDEDRRLPFELVRLGPSALNRQPWRIVSDKQGCHFYCLRKTKPGNGGSVDLTRLDMGIAMCHFDLGAKALGWRGEWRIENPGLSPLPENVLYAFSYIKK